MENHPGGQTTTRTTVSETQVQTNLRFDPSYLSTIPGMLKLGAVILDIIFFICILCGGPYWRTHPSGDWGIFVSMTGFWVTGILLLFYLMHICEKFHVIPWLLIEFVFCALWSFFYLTTAIDTAVACGKDYGAKSFGAASFFGFVTMVAYGFDAFLKFKGWRGGQLAQGQRVVQETEVRATSY